MKRLIISTVLLGFNLMNPAISQNLVVNGGFESYSALPTGVAQWWKCSSWNNVNMNTGATVTYATPDYYHANANQVSGYSLPSNLRANIAPHTGSAIMGFLTDNNAVANFREYLSNTLASPMVVGETYTVSFWLSNGDDTQHRQYGESTNGIGIRFSTSALTQATNGVINVTPQLEIPGIVWNTTWTLYSFVYTATSAWTRITIGNFKNDANTLVAVADPTATYTAGAYYFIDDVSIVLFTPLPVELMDFYAHQRDKYVELEWSTASENNNDYFTVERSTDLIEWQLVGKIQGAGNSTTENTYLLTDRNPLKGITYYRLQQTDYDGKTNFSGIQTVDMENNESPIMYPNPTNDKITIEADWEFIEEYSIIDNFGRDLTNMIHIYDGPNKLSKVFDLSVLSSGVYYFISDDTQQKIIKL